MIDPITINTAEDVTATCLARAEEIYEGWFDTDEPVDWESFWDRLDHIGWSVATLDCAAAKKIQRHIRRYKALV